MIYMFNVLARCITFRRVMKLPTEILTNFMYIYTCRFLKWCIYSFHFNYVLTNQWYHHRFMKRIIVGTDKFAQQTSNQQKIYYVYNKMNYITFKVKCVVLFYFSISKLFENTYFRLLLFCIFATKECPTMLSIFFLNYTYLT